MQMLRHLKSNELSTCRPLALPGGGTHVHFSAVTQARPFRRLSLIQDPDPIQSCCASVVASNRAFFYRSEADRIAISRTMHNQDASDGVEQMQP